MDPTPPVLLLPEGPADEIVDRDVAPPGWRAHHGFDLPDEPWDLADQRLVCIGTVDDEASARAAIAAVARGVGLAVRVSHRGSGRHRFLEDLHKIATPVAYEAQARATTDALWLVAGGKVAAIGKPELAGQIEAIGDQRDTCGARSQRSRNSIDPWVSATAWLSMSQNGPVAGTALRMTALPCKAPRKLLRTSTGRSASMSGVPRKLKGEVQDRLIGPRPDLRAKSPQSLLPRQTARISAWRRVQEFRNAGASQLSK